MQDIHTTIGELLERQRLEIAKKLRDCIYYQNDNLKVYPLKLMKIIKELEEEKENGK